MKKKSNQPTLPDARESLKLMRQCPLCQKEYLDKNISVLFKQENTQLIHLACANCTAGVVAAMTINQFGLSSVGMVTDLSATDVTRVWKKDSFAADEVLSFYHWLETDHQFSSGFASPSLKTTDEHSKAAPDKLF